MIDPTGLKTAVESAHDAGQSVPGSMAATQLDLLCEGGSGQQNAEKVVPAPRGRGRPPGAINKSTKEWASFLLTHYSSPLQGLADISTMPLKDLAKELGLNVDLTYDKALELLKLQVSCMNALAPYVHQKMPVALDAGENGLIQLVINTGTPAQQTIDAPAPAIEFIDFNDESNQGVSDAE